MVVTAFARTLILLAFSYLRFRCFNIDNVYLLYTYVRSMRELTFVGYHHVRLLSFTASDICLNICLKSLRTVSTKSSLKVPDCNESSSRRKARTHVNSFRTCFQQISVNLETKART